jgi:4-amino-4-deoxy-L-arabinose transferase-like glycosyltransferase
MELAKERQYALKRAAAIAVLFVGAVGARLFWIGQVRSQWGDEPFYTWLSGGLPGAQTASGLQAGSLAPLFPALANGIARSLQSAGMFSTPALELSTILPYVLFGGLLVAPVYGIARRMGGEAIAAGAGLATAFYPAMLSGLPGPAAMIEPMYLLLVAAAWYFLLIAVDEGALWPAAAGGLFVGLAYLTRPEAFVYLVFALGLLLVATWLSRRQTFALRRAVANFGIALVTFALIAGPYLPAFFQVHL